MAKSKRQALYFIKQAQKVAEEEGFKQVAKSMDPVRKKLEEEVLAEDA